MPDDTRPDGVGPVRARAVRPKHAASLVVLRGGGPDTLPRRTDVPQDAVQTGNAAAVLMGLRGSRHRFMPNRLVFPGGRVDPADARARCATPLPPHAERRLLRNANADLARALGIAAARELREETGLSLGEPPRLDALHYLGRAVTPPNSPIRFNARFFLVEARHVSGTIGGDGELEGLRFYALAEALGLDLALPTRMVLGLVQSWLDLPEAERTTIAAAPVMLRDRGWTAE